METINKKFLKNLAIVAVFLIFVLAINARQHSSKIRSVLVAGQNIKVDVASSDKDKAQGLSGRTLLREDEGMLFIFDTPGKYDFWMKDMNFPIDIIWLDADLRVVYVKKDARPELYPEQYGPDQDSKYILEVVSGFAEKNNLQIGDSVTFTY